MKTKAFAEHGCEALPRVPFMPIIGLFLELFNAGLVVPYGLH